MDRNVLYPIEVYLLLRLKLKNFHCIIHDVCTHAFAGTSHQFEDNSSTSSALGAVVGLLLLALIGLLVIIAILAVKLRRNDRKYKGRSTDQDTI